jgi:hypothetical protein
MNRLCINKKRKRRKRKNLSRQWLRMPKRPEQLAEQEMMLKLRHTLAGGCVDRWEFD